MRRVVFSLALLLPLLLLLIAGTVSAETYRHEEGGVEMDVPSGFSVDMDGEQIAVETPDESMIILMWVPEGDTWEAALDALGDELDQFLEDVEVESEGEEGELNGMPYYELYGTGEAEGIELVWSLSLLMAKKPVIVLAFAEPEAFEANESSVTRFVRSIKKIG